MELTKKDIFRLRVYNSGLIKPFNNVEDCVSSLFGIQSQAQQFGEISLWNRVHNTKQENLKELYESHKIIKLWGQRMTVHMYCLNDWKAVHQVFAHRNNFVKKGWSDKNPSLDLVLNKIDLFTANKKCSKQEIIYLIEETVPHITDSYRDYSLLLQACMNGILFGIPQNPQTKHFVHRTVCIDEKEYETWSDNKISSLKYILLNYFKYYGPATLSDFCHWSGLTKKEIQEAFKQVINQLYPFSLDNKIYYLIDNNTENIMKDFPGVKLLGKFDPLFVSFSDKTWIADEKQQKAIWRPAAHIEAVILGNDKILGTWRYAIKGKSIEFIIYPFKSIPASSKKLLKTEAEKMAGFLSKKLNKVIYE